MAGAGAGRAEGGLEGGGSLPALLDKGEGEQRWGATVLSSEEESAGLRERSGEKKMTEGTKSKRRNKLKMAVVLN